MATATKQSLPVYPSDSQEYIRVRGCRVHNLKNIDVDIPHNALTVVTGVSGSGKSSLAFDTLYAEGQRRYVESMTAYARQFLERMEKPDADEITGIAPAVAIRQKAPTRNPRSTVGTATEIYDYLRLLFARVGRTYCAQCGGEVKKDSVDEVAERLLTVARESGKPEGLRAYVLFPMLRAAMRAGEGEAPTEPQPSAEVLKNRLFELRRLGFNRLYQKGQTFEFSTPESLLEMDFAQPVWVLADRLVLAEDSRQRLIDSIEICYREGGEAVVELAEPLGSENAAQPTRFTFNERFECKRCRIVYEEPEPHLFSFNSPTGACPRCQGFGNTIDFDPQLVIPNPTLALEDGAVEPWTKPRYRRFYNEFRKAAKDVRLDVPFFQLTEEEKEFVWQGDGRRRIGVRGFFNYLERKKYKLHVRVFLSRYRGYAVCPECRGGRLRQEAYQVQVGGKNLRAVCQMSIEQARQFFDDLQLTKQQEAIADKILQEVRQRLRVLEEVGLEYLTLDRLAMTLAGGEAQRIQLAAALGSRLVGAMYVLDEPSIGLHNRDTYRLIRILHELRDLGNTILVVEHDAGMMEASDHILDLGPGAGENGGRVQYAGSYQQLLAQNGTLTGRYLRGDLRISLPARRRPPAKKQLKILGAFDHNLKNIDVTIPLGMMVAVTGVSGSGKSTLVHDVLYAALRRPGAESSEQEWEGAPESKKLGCRRVEGSQHISQVILVDQSPIGRTPRSNPVTYVKAFDSIRALIAEQPEARKRGYAPGVFSFNIAGGRCDACQGSGIVTVEMQFLADVELVCEECKGTRYKSGVLDVRYRNKNIHEVLQLTVKEALAFFSGATSIVNRLRVLDEVGLGYLRLGQSATTLSGGEAQRIKLAAHLVFGDNESALYILDEPTTGLHFDDIAKLLGAFRKLLDNGASLLIIEHNLDVIKTADWVIDLGPEGGEGGGEVVCVGTPEAVARCARSYTGKYLRKVLDKHRQWGEVASGKTSAARS
ncbi:MAG: excinuclease ABC subunit A [Acidobacteria bacterium RIFCSPLOWO2_02_FULL_59_13]|nr:MAG: excinuclease ABC subunit A [Acidobacteria bacterium RIFCSPLOWO2_02_FULL_59_13]